MMSRRNAHKRDNSLRICVITKCFSVNKLKHESMENMLRSLLVIVCLFVAYVKRGISL